MADFVFLSPGVKTREVDFSTFVAGLASSVFGVVFTSTKGPIGTRTLMTTQKQFVTTYGEPDGDSYGPYACINILAVATQVYAMRVGTSAAKESSGDILSGAVAAFVDAENVFVSTDLTTSTGTGDLVITVEGTDYTLPNATWKLWNDAGLLSDYTNFISFLKVNCKSGVLANLETVADVTVVGGKLKITSKLKGAGSAVELNTAKNQNLTGLLAMMGIPSVATTTLSDAGEAGQVLATASALTKGTHGDKIRLEAYDIGYTDIVSGQIDPYGFKLRVFFTESQAEEIKETWQVSSDPANDLFFETVINNNSTFITIENKQPAGPILIADLQTRTSSVDSSISLVEGHDGILEGVSLLSQVFIPSTVGADPNAILVKSQGAGAISDDIDVTVENVVGDLFDIIVVKRFGAGTVDDVGEVFKAVTTDPAGPRWIGDPLLTTSHVYDGAGNTVVEGSPASSALVTFDYLLTLATQIRAGAYQLSANIPALGSAEVIGTQSTGSGLEGFTNVEEVDIDLLLAPGFTEPEVINKLLAVCENRGDCMTIMDTPFGLTPLEVIQWHNGQAPFDDHQAFASSYGAFYWSWQKIFDPYTAQDIFVPPSGQVGNRYAFTDRNFTFWDQPAGLKRGRLLDSIEAEYDPTQGDRDAMYSGGNAINPIVNFRFDGLTIFGGRTAQRFSSKLDRVGNRRLLLKIRKAIAASVRVLVFDIINDVLYTNFRGIVEPYLDGIKADGGLEDFRVIMDDTTVTDDDKNNNRAPGKILVILPGFAEFIPLDFVVMRSGASFTEFSNQSQ